MEGGAVARTCREAVLGAIVRLESRHGRREFDLAEIVAETLALDRQFAESTVRTHLTSRMCREAPDHDATVYAALRIDRGRLRLTMRRAARER